MNTSALSRRQFSSLIVAPALLKGQHLGRCIFDGGSPLSDAEGFRRDVMKAAKDLRVTLDLAIQSPTYSTETIPLFPTSIVPPPTGPMERSSSM